MLSVPFSGGGEFAAIVVVARDPDRASIKGLSADPHTPLTVFTLPAGNYEPSVQDVGGMAATLKEGRVIVLLCRRPADALKATSWCRAAAGGGE
jgi:hypothetical protein